MNENTMLLDRFRVDGITAPFGLLDVVGDGQIEGAHEDIDPRLVQRIGARAWHLNVSAATLFHAAWALVLSHTSGRDDVMFGTLLLGRSLPLRLRLQNVTVQELVEQTRLELVQLLANEGASIAVADRFNGISESASLFRTILIYRCNSVYGDSRFPLGNYSMVLSVDDQGDGIRLHLDTDRLIDPRRMLGYLTEAMQSLVEALESEVPTPAVALSILPPLERHQVLKQFNAIQTLYPHGKLVHELFEEQVQKTPDAVAVTYEGQSLTYAELNARANQLARYLRELGVGPDQLVGICIERSLEMVVGLVGVLKAGGAYVPLDPAYPADRLTYMLEDAAPRVLLIQERLRAQLHRTNAEVIALDQQWDVISEHSTSNLRMGGMSGDCLAYVIYTSGSTGQPKGVMVEHRNVTRLFAATQQWFHFNEHDVWTLFHSFAFDFSVWELWGALLHGGRLVVVPYLTARSAQEFYRLVCKEGVTVLNQTPSAFAHFIRAQAQVLESQHSLRAVIFGGEALEVRALRPWVQRNGATVPQLVNMYGITETTVHVTYRLLSDQEIESERSSPIGKPIPDLQAYLLNSHGQPVPIGVTGELYVGGGGVVRGYLNRPDLTAQRFVSNPFVSDSQARLYKTGDLGRWRADGSIEYLGRNDHQVKIRGFRIELGEIEAQLLRHEQVKEAVVITREDGPAQKRLVAYLVVAETPPTIDALRTHLKAVLPEHMVPSAFVMLESLPLTINGKLDRKALPAATFDSDTMAKFVAPRTELESDLAQIWAEVLRRERVGVNDNFFEIGGDSLLANSVIARISQALDINLSFRVMFDHPTIEQLGRSLLAQIAAELSTEVS